MNPDSITPQQPQLPPHHVSNSMKIVMLLLGLALITTLGYFTWFVGSEQEATEEVAPSVKDKTEETAKKETCADAAAGFKLYESSNLGFCLTYPSAWTMTDGKPADTGDKRVWYVSLTDKVMVDTDYPGQATVSVWNKLADLDGSNTGATTLKAYLDKAAALTDPLYADVKTATVGGKSGFSAKEGPGQFNPESVHYFVELTNGNIIEVQVHYTNTDTTALLASLKITK